MTALADIAKAHPTLHGDSLRGSDLAQFNIQHKRDAQGRFAAIAASPAQIDPRAARKARVKRRQRRAVRGGIARAEIAAVAAAAAEAEKAKEAKSDPRALQALHRPRIALQRVQTRVQNRVQAKPQAAPEKAKDKAKIALNDTAYLDEAEFSVALKDASFTVVDREQALQFHLDKSMIVGAANAKWDTQLEAFNLNQLSRHVQENDMEGKVVLQISPRALVTERSMGPDAKVLANSQYLALSQSDDDTDLEKYPSFAAQMAELPTYMRSQPVARLQALPIISVDAWSPFEALYMLPADKYPNIDKPVKKADETWDEDEHKRDPRSGRFTALAQAQAAPTGTVIDPRAARAQRRKRRARRGAAAHAATAVEEKEQAPERGRRILEERRQQRITARRAEPRYRTRVTGKPIPQQTPAVEPQAEGEPPKRAPGRLIYGGTGAGGRIVSQDQYEAIQRAAGEERVSVYTPNRQLKIKPAVVEVPVESRKIRLRETEALGSQPRFIYDEYGDPINLAEIKAYQAAKRAHARKPSS